MSHLIITRRPGEIVCLGSNVVITILRLSRNQVALSITAPPEVSVDRDEVRKKKIAEGLLPEGEVK